MIKREEFQQHIKPLAIGLVFVGAVRYMVAQYNVDLFGGFYFSLILFIGCLIASLLSTNINIKISFIYGVIIYLAANVMPMSASIIAGAYAPRILLSVFLPSFLLLFCLPAVLGSVAGYYLRKLLKK
ncbi:MAG: hypothetical protein HZB68_00325 [Candidatus Aenigmarchaeota archaeon]|nr:hypothetical protein [Candidatus Aenigmarchaeota archaeon]